MNPYAAITLAIAVLQLSLGLVVLGIVRAPEWRGVWPFAVISLSAGVFSLVNVIYIVPGLPDGLLVAGMRINFFVAAIHCAAWIVFSFADREGRIMSVPPVARWVTGALLAVGALFCATGVHLVPGEFITPVVVMGETKYRLGRTNLAGTLFGGWCLAMLAAAFWGFLQRIHLEGKRAWPVMLGFGVFFACAINEVLIASELLHFYALADVGFLAIVLPVAGDILQRFVADAKRLRELSARLSGEVEERTHERDQAQGALLEAERHAALGRLAAGVGHEINNPLTYLALNLDTLEEWMHVKRPPPAIAEAAAGVREASDRIARVVEGLRTATRTTTGNRRALDPHQLCESALRVARPQLRHIAKVSTKLDAVPRVVGDEAKLVQVLVNLLNNAAHALAQRQAEGNDAQIQVRTSTTANGDALIAVTDNGPGIASDDLARVTEPYFTTRAESGGTGLGLFLSRQMIEQHEGTLSIDSSHLRGTTVRIVLPAGATDDDVPAEGSAPAAGREPESAGTGPGERVVLVVDDEPRVLEAFRRALAGTGRVVAVSSGSDALREVEQGLDPDVIVCDLMMPGIGGIALRERLMAAGFAAGERMLFITGGAVTDEARAFVERSDVHVLYKPVSAREIREAVRARFPVLSGSSADGTP
jgi:signal transduction histidine kinase/CheY-like chemotaxis protein